MEKRKWYPIKEIIDIMSRKKWSWFYNERCKYIELRLDTRDGHCLIKDRYGKEITIEELKNQKI